MILLSTFAENTGIDRLLTHTGLFFGLLFNPEDGRREFPSKQVRFEVLTAVIMKDSIIWSVTSWTLLECVWTLRRKSLPLSSVSESKPTKTTSSKHFVAGQKAEAVCFFDRSVNFTRLHGVESQKIMLFAINMDGKNNTDKVEVKSLCLIN
jgi:hypothetical protein